MSKIAQCDPRLLDFVTWSVLRGVRLFQRVRVTSSGLIASDTIPQYDFAAVVPARAVLSVLNVVDDMSYPIRVSPQTAGNQLEWWPDLSLGCFAFIGLLTRSWITGVEGIQSYLDTLPLDQEMPIGNIAVSAQKTRQYRTAVKDLQDSTSIDDVTFDIAFKNAYCLYRRYGVPLWSAKTGGHPYFASSDIAAGKGDIIGMVPVIDLAAHSPTPNAMIGFPDKEMTHWLAQEKGLQTNDDNQYIVLQTLKDIKDGELITVDRNQFHGFDRDTFHSWFGFPYDATAK